MGINKWVLPSLAIMATCACEIIVCVCWIWFSGDNIKCPFIDVSHAQRWVFFPLLDLGASCEDLDYVTMRGMWSTCNPTSCHWSTLSLHFSKKPCSSTRTISVRKHKYQPHFQGKDMGELIDEDSITTCPPSTKIATNQGTQWPLW